MNFFRISPKSVPLAPQDAPRLPDESHSVPIVAFSVMFILAVIITEFQPLFTFAVVAGLSVCWYNHIARRRLYKRIGWYERRETMLLELPFIVHGRGERVIFSHEAITFSSDRYQKNKLARVVPYSDIATVHTHCQGLCMTGLELKLVSEEPETLQTRFVIAGIVLRTGQAIKHKPPILIPEGRDGEWTRTSLAILRAKAPQATFTGPRWIEEGWVPRQGFTQPSTGVGGGGGP